MKKIVSNDTHLYFFDLYIRIVGNTPNISTVALLLLQNESKNRKPNRPSIYFGKKRLWNFSATLHIVGMKLNSCFPEP